jgi:hypothetical protein
MPSQEHVLAPLVQISCFLPLTSGLAKETRPKRLATVSVPDIVRTYASTCSIRSCPTILPASYPGSSHLKILTLARLVIAFAAHLHTDSHLKPNYRCDIQFSPLEPADPVNEQVHRLPAFPWFHVLFVLLSNIMLSCFSGYGLLSPFFFPVVSYSRSRRSRHYGYGPRHRGGCCR